MSSQGREELPAAIRIQTGARGSLLLPKLSLRLWVKSSWSLASLPSVTARQETPGRRAELGVEEQRPQVLT